MINNLGKFMAQHSQQFSIIYDTCRYIKCPVKKKRKEKEQQQNGKSTRQRHNNTSYNNNNNNNNNNIPQKTQKQP